MKRLVITGLTVLITVKALAQAEISKLQFNKEQQTAVLYNLSYSENAVVNGVENRMNKYGKPKKVKSFLMYRNIHVSDIHESPITIYIGIEKKSKNDDNTQLSLLIANEFDRYYTATENEELFNKAKSFVNGFAEPVAAADLELKIVTQQEVYNKQEKKIKKLKDDAADYEKQKKKLEEKIADNAKVTASEEETLNIQKTALDALLKQRKN